MTYANLPSGVNARWRGPAPAAILVNGGLLGGEPSHLVGQNLIQPEIGHEHRLAVRREHRGVAVRAGLTPAIHARALMLHEGGRFAQRAIVMHGVFGDAAAAVVRDVQEFAGRVQRQVAGTIAAGRHGIQQLQLAGLGVHGERTDAARLLAFVIRYFVDRVEELAIRVDGQKGGAGGFAHQADRGEFPGGRLKAPRINPLALVGSRVGSDISDVLALGALGGLCDAAGQQAGKGRRGKK